MVEEAMCEARSHEFESRQPQSGDLMRNNTATCNLMMLYDWCGYRVKINFFAIFKRCFLIGSEIFAKFAFAVTFFTESSLSSVAFGKLFAECKRIIADCIRTLGKVGRSGSDFS